MLGTLIINHIVVVMKESNLNNAPMEWQASKTSYELANGFLMRRLHLEPEEDSPPILVRTLSIWMKPSLSPVNV